VKHPWMATLAAALAVGTAWGQDGVQTKKDVEYAVHDGVSLKGDLYQPMAGAAHPAMVFIHGGGFRGGSKNGYGNGWGPYLAARGIVVFAIDYRLFTPTQTTYPQALLDSKAAVQYLRGNAAALGIDPERIGVGGDSAGATLASLVGLTQDSPRFANKYPMDAYTSASTKVKVVVPAYAIHDMMSWEMISQKTGKGALEGFLGGSPDTAPGAYFETSPLTYVREGSTKLGDLAVPNAGLKSAWFVAWGTADKVVPPENQSQAFAAALKEAGANVTAIPVPDQNHFWFVATQLTGKHGNPVCEEMTGGKYTCSGPTPNDYIEPQFMAFLSKNL
jgi:acetyl esterase/lipase